jgi:hypothetical protein
MTQGQAVQVLQGALLHKASPCLTWDAQTTQYLGEQHP